jgi:hypothetical protein
MKIAFNVIVILAGAGLGLATGYALRFRHAATLPTPAVAERMTPADRQVPLQRNSGAQEAAPGDDSPLATRLERDLAKAKGITRWLLWSEAVEKAQPADFSPLVRLGRNNPAVLQLIAARWAEIAPRHLFDTLVAASKGSSAFPLHELARVLFQEWPKRDPESAIAALNEPVTSGMQRAWRMDVATTVINNDIERGLRLFAEWHIENYLPFYDERGPVPKWVVADPRHAAEVALQQPASYLLRTVEKVIGEEWAKTDPAAALKFAAGAGGQFGSTMGTAALKGWAERDLNEAADWLAASEDSVRNRLGPGFVEAWAKKDAAGALGWCEENLSGSSLSRAATALIQGAGVKQVASSAALVAAMEPSPARAEAAAAVAQQWFPMLGGMAGPSGEQTVGPQTVAWLRGLDPISIKRVLDDQTWSWATSDPGSMADFLLTMTNFPLDPWTDTCLARQMAQKTPTEALAWAAQLPGNRAIVAGGEAYAVWRSAQPEAATQWLNNLPADDPRSEPFFQSAIRLLAYNPQAPELLAGMTPQERGAARTVIENMTSLAADQRARLLAGLSSH